MEAAPGMSLRQLLWIIDDLSDSHCLRQRSESVLNKLFTTGRHSGQSVWLNCHALSAVGTLLRKNASYAHLVGKDEFDQIYQLAVGENAPPLSFLCIMAHSQSEKFMFYARFDERLAVESDDED